AAYVAFWHEADKSRQVAHVRFRSKADIRCRLALMARGANSPTRGTNDLQSDPCCNPYRCDSRGMPAAIWLGRVWSSAGPQRAVQVERSADQCKVRESLREVSQGLAAMPSLLCIEAGLFGEAYHPLENQSRLLEPRPVVAAGPGQRLDQPKRTDVEGAFLSG